MRLWKSFRMQRRGDISIMIQWGSLRRSGFAVNLNQLIAEEMVEKQKAGVNISVYRYRSFYRGQSGSAGGA